MIVDVVLLSQDNQCNVMLSPSHSIVEPVLVQLAVAISVGIDVHRHGAHSVDVLIVQRAFVAILVIVLPDADGIVHKHTIHSASFCAAQGKQKSQQQPAIAHLPVSFGLASNMQRDQRWVRQDIECICVMAPLQGEKPA